jgi:hypothetical protein
MKFLRFTLSILFSALLGLNSAAQSDVQLNLVTIKNDAVVGGELQFKVQIRSTGSSFNLGTSNINFTTSQAILYKSIEPLNFSNAPYSPMTATYNASARRVSIMIDPDNLIAGNGSPVSDSTGWTDVAKVTYEIVSFLDLSVNFAYMGLASFPNKTEIRDDNGVSKYGVNQLDAFDRTRYVDTNSVIVPGNGIWSGGNGPNGAPDSTDGVKRIIVNSGTAILTGHVECDFFSTSIAGAALMIAPNATLITYNQVYSGYIVDSSYAFILDADSTGYGQYIGPTVDGTIRQYIGTDAGWRNIGFPVNGNGFDFDVSGGNHGFGASSTSFNATPDCGGNWGNYVNTVSVYRFNKGPQPHEWYGAAAAPTGSTEGYNIYTGEGAFGNNGFASIRGTFFDQNAPVTYFYEHTDPHDSANGTGTGSQSAVDTACIPESDPADRIANWNGWALLVNPYPCNIDVDTFALANGIANTNVRIWDRSEPDPALGVQGKYIDRAGATIPPMQAFWIKLGTPGTTDTITFPGYIRTFSAGSFTKTSPPEVQLIASNTNTQEETAVHLRFNPNATIGYDRRYDAYVLYQPGNTVPQLSFHHLNPKGSVDPLDYNTVPMPTEATAYPLRFWSRSSGNFSFAVDPAVLPPGLEAYIEDTKLAPGTYYPVSNGSTYNFSYTRGIDVTERFILHVGPLGTIGFDEQENIATGHVYVASNNEAMTLHFQNVEAKSARVQITNEVGQVVYRADEVSTHNPHVFHLSARRIGLYIVTVELDNGDISYHKVIH